MNILDIDAYNNLDIPNHNVKEITLNQVIQELLTADAKDVESFILENQSIKNSIVARINKDLKDGNVDIENLEKMINLKRKFESDNYQEVLKRRTDLLETVSKLINS